MPFYTNNTAHKCEKYVLLSCYPRLKDYHLRMYVHVPHT